MGAHQRNKGKRGETEVVKLLTDYGYLAERTASLQAGSGKVLRGDVTVYGTDRRRWPDHEWVSIEAKRSEPVKLHTAALASAMEQFGGGTGCVLWRGDRQPWSLSCWAYGYIATFDAAKVLEDTACLSAWLRAVRGLA